jgi:hypothetical protein
MSKRGVGLMVVALGLGGCSSGGPRGPDDATPLRCGQTDACKPLDMEIADACASKSTVRRQTCGNYTVLSVATDPNSYVYTKENRYYDSSGRLVGTSMFVSEYARFINQGEVPSCADSAPPVTVCGSSSQ